MAENKGYSPLGRAVVDALTEPASAEDALRRAQRSFENAEREVEANEAEKGANHSHRSTLIQYYLSRTDNHLKTFESYVDAFDGFMIFAKALENRNKKLGGRIEHLRPEKILVEIFSRESPELALLVLALLEGDIKEASRAFASRGRGKKKGPFREEQAVAVYAAVEWMRDNGRAKSVVAGCKNFAEEVERLPKTHELRKVFAGDRGIFNPDTFRTLYYEGRKAAESRFGPPEL